MNSELHHRIEQSTAGRIDREKNRNLALRDDSFLKTVITVAFNPEDKNHHKGCWILELVCEKKLKLFVPYFDNFCEVLPQLKNDSAIRPMSKICLFLAKSNHRANGITLSQLQETQIIEICFDWLIREEKVATKVYAMKALFVFGKKYDWIYPELKNIIQQDYPNHTPAYQAATRNLLKKLNKKKA
ncbi:MAG: hypothetical protein QM535_02935 [Limnohabitans sp.]|nr:hypothetical protein [Limnohabitans sp.]